MYICLPEKDGFWKQSQISWGSKLRALFTFVMSTLKSTQNEIEKGQNKNKCSISSIYILQKVHLSQTLWIYLLTVAFTG